MTVLLSTGFGVALSGEEGTGGSRQLKEKDHRGGGMGGGFWPDLGGAGTICL